MSYLQNIFLDRVLKVENNMLQSNTTAYSGREHFTTLVCTWVNMTGGIFLTSKDFSDRPAAMAYSIEHSNGI